MTNIRQLKTDGGIPTRPPETLGERMRIARLATEAYQGDIAKVLEVSRQTVNDWETDKRVPSVAILYAWASITDCSLEWLRHGTPVEKPAKTAKVSNRRSQRLPNVSDSDAVVLSDVVGRRTLVGSSNICRG